MKNSTYFLEMKERERKRYVGDVVGLGPVLEDGRVGDG
jgi:hypothetical protein